VRALVLKVVREDSTSYDGFKWPESGPVTAETWNPKDACGDGLHGWLGGEGMYRHEYMTGKWIVFAVDQADLVKLDGGDKVKARTGEVVYHGDKPGAVAFLKEHGAITKDSNPGWCCFTDTQLRELAHRAANRAVKKHAPKRLRARGREDLAMKLEALPDIVDRATALQARDAAASAASDAAYAAYAAAAASDAYAASDAAASAASDAAASAAYAAYAADAAAAYARAKEREAQRQDRLQLLGVTQ
jgi:hypothetical protein